MKIYLILWLSILFPGELKHSLCVFWNVYLSIGIFIYNLGYYFFLVGLFTVVINSFVALCLILCHQLDSKPLEGRYYAYHVQCWFLVPCIMPGTEYVLKLLINRKTYLLRIFVGGKCAVYYIFMVVILLLFFMVQDSSKARQWPSQSNPF